MEEEETEEEKGREREEEEREEGREEGLGWRGVLSFYRFPLSI